MLRSLALLFLGVLAFNVDAQDKRAHTNYMLHCQGCHLPQGEGALGAVPRLQNFVGYFLHSREGRKFIAQVPGVTMSSLDDEELTELLNWLVRAYSEEQLPSQFVPYTSEEIAELRKTPNLDPLGKRNSILDLVAKGLPVLADEIATSGYAY